MMPDRLFPVEIKLKQFTLRAGDALSYNVKKSAREIRKNSTAAPATGETGIVSFIET